MSLHEQLQANTAPNLPPIAATGISRRWILSRLSAITGGILLGTVAGCNKSEHQSTQEPTPAETSASATMPPASEAPQAQSEFSAKPVWLQDFVSMPDGPVDATVWSHDTDPETPTYNDEKQAYTPNNVRVVRGRGLIIEARKEKYRYPHDPADIDYAITSGRILARGASFEYGRIEAQMKLPKGKGTWPAFWLLSANQVFTNPMHPTDEQWEQQRFYLHDGELDIMEAAGSKPGLIEATFHSYRKSTEGHVTVPDAEDAFHIYGLDITPNELRWTLDGKPYFTFRKPENATPDTWPIGNNNQFYPILNLAMGGEMGGPIDMAKNKWQLEIRRVAQYAFTGANIPR